MDILRLGGAQPAQGGDDQGRGRGADGGVGAWHGHRYNAVKGILPLEHALSSGSAILSHVELLRTSVEGLGKDSLLELALSSLREDVLDYGSDIRMDLKQKALLLEANEAEHKHLPRLLQDELDVSKDIDKYEKELKDTRSKK